jgi:hypothetical protein
MDTQQIQQVVATIRPGMTPDQLAEIREGIDMLKQITRELDKAWDAGMTEVVREAGPMIVGFVKYYLGLKKKTNCKSKAKALDAAMALAGGDLEAACRDFLASEPFKHGAMKKALQDNPVANWDDLFEVVEVEELKEGEAKAAKTLQAIDTRFLR